mgnify:CR=1 FL=1
MEDKIKDLTRGDITGHLYRIALPIMGTSFVQIAYNFTDMIWLGRLSAQALAAVGAASVFLWIAASFALINKVGSEVFQFTHPGRGATVWCKVAYYRADKQA